MPRDQYQMKKGVGMMQQFRQKRMDPLMDDDAIVIKNQHDLLLQLVEFITQHAGKETGGGQIGTLNRGQHLLTEGGI